MHYPKPQKRAPVLLIGVISDKGVQNMGDERTPDKREKRFQPGIINTPEI
jgi:hypothetical protein